MIDFNSSKWTLQQAVELCTELELVAPFHGCHIGLTGGSLYKTGYRKDLDIILYKIRQVEQIDWKNLFKQFETKNVFITRNCGFVKKAVFKTDTGLKEHEKSIDFLYPEYSGYSEEYGPVAQDPTHNLYGDFYP